MEQFNEKLIAPCGINCGVCLHYLRTENKCPGCFSGRKVNGRPIRCGRKLCTERKGEFCYDCDKFPCDSIKRLDKRYQEHYDMSPIANLEFIRGKGMDNFLESQKKKFISAKGTLCIHDKKYYE